MDGGRQGNKRRVGAARRRSRGHGPARLDGTRPRATVADKVMKSGKTAGHGNGFPTRRPHGKRKRAGPKLEAGPEASAERSEGTMEARQGRDAAGGSMRYAHESATGHLPGGRRRPAFNAKETARSGRAHARHCGCDAAAVWPIRRSRVGGLRGAPSLRGGDSPQGFPLECKRSAQRRRREGIGSGRSKKKGAPLPKERRTEGSAARSARRRRRHRLQLFDHARLNEYASLLVFDQHVEYLREHRAP